MTDHIYRKLRTAGIGASKKSTEIVTIEEENTLWERGVLGIHTPQALLNATFFLNGKNLALKGGKEQSQLKFSQLQQLTNPDRYVYRENGSKNRSGGIADFRVPNKEVTIHSNRENPLESHMFLSQLLRRMHFTCNVSFQINVEFLLHHGSKHRR